MIRPLARVAIAVGTLTLAACGTDSHVCWTTDTPDQLADRPSPLDSATVVLAERQVKVCYGRPSARERPVMGALVPFGSVWRFGANEATSIGLPFPAEIGGVAVQPGAYSLYVVPGSDSWTVTVNGLVERWGIPVDPDVQAADVGSFTVPVEAVPEHVETFTMTLHDAGADRAELVAEWERTRIRIPIVRVEG